ncbi:MAG: gamma-glutamyl-gamma-aminobutyrate hydrolase family protein [Ferruginibacter sp.]
MTEETIKIGVTFTGTDEKHNNYFKWLAGNDVLDIIALSSQSCLQLIPTLDGIVLSGGIDMHPSYYGNDEIHYPHAPAKFNNVRDAFEVEVFRLCQQHQLPLLGICRGMQLVNCVLGGTLLQDVGLIGNIIHRCEQNDKAHGINIFPGTLLHDITGLNRAVINSAHHQSINILADDLMANCTSDDGLIEGVEWADPQGKSFFLGVQWHPERMFNLHLDNSPLTKNVRDRFISEVKLKAKNDVLK